MTLLGDEQAIGIRKLIVEKGYFTGLEVFPMKDRVEDRVFPEAKQATAVFTMVVLGYRVSDRCPVAFHA